MKRFNYRGVRVATQFLICKVVVQKGMRSAYIVRSPKDDNVITRKKKMEALLMRKLPNFNLSAGQWGLDDLTSSLVIRAFPRLFDLDPPPET